MNRFTITLGVLTAATGALLSVQASAATVAKYTSKAASGACQGALPNYEGNFRKRPLAVVNEGSTAAFLTCGIDNPDGDNGTNRVELYVVNRTGAAADISCTMVDGFVDATMGFANYYPQTITANTTSYSFFQWTGSYSPYSQSVSCNVPAAFEVNLIALNYNDEIGA